MTIPQILDSPIQVEAQMTGQQIQPQTITWRQQTQAVIATGRQWTEADGRHILVEVLDGSRMEIRLGTDLSWRLLRYWPGVTQA